MKKIDFKDIEKMVKKHKVDELLHYFHTATYRGGSTIEVTLQMGEEYKSKLKPGFINAFTKKQHNAWIYSKYIFDNIEIIFSRGQLHE